MSQVPEQEQPIRAVDADGVTAVALGTAAWAVAWLVLFVFFRANLAERDASWWLWVCAVGAGLGLVGLPYVVKRRAVYQRHAAQSDGEESSL